MTPRCLDCGHEVEPDDPKDACQVCGYDGYSDWGAHHPKRVLPRHKRPLPEDYEPQWDPRERD